MTLYHATESTDVTLAIVQDGFRGGDVWDYRGVVFLADRPLSGFGGWRDTWVAVEVPDAELATGRYPEAEQWDDGQYHARCYCFRAAAVNRWPRRAILEQ